VTNAQTGSPNVVISQIYGGGGNKGATLKNDFIELFNRGTLPVNVNGWTVQHAAADGSNWDRTFLTGTIQPGQYYLVQEQQGDGGTLPLPTPDAIGGIGISATSDKIALVNNSINLTGNGPNGFGVVDFVGYGGANAAEGQPASALNNTTALIRNSGGCTDSNSNRNDFSVSAPNPRSSRSTINPCSTVLVTSVTPTLPFGSFDTPVTNTTGVVGAIPVTGWALDNIEVTHVDVLREPVVGEPAGTLIFIGTAVFSADARPDVQTMFPTYPFSYRAGWGYQMLTNFLPNASGSGASGNGTYKLHAIAFNSSGGQLDLGTRMITVDNTHATKPFGTIDTPGPGSTISGADSVNFGWALTPQTAMISTDGSAITVVIDGVSVGHPVYNNFRSDIANLFPGFANSMGAVGFVHVNTTTLANGVHTISWNALDNQGRGEGLGSRYFNVLNAGGGGVAAPEDVIDESVAREGVGVRHGLNINREPDPVAPDADGGYSVTMEEVGHIELYVGAVSGNLMFEGEARALPTGSTLKGGIFYWQPGPGFLGEYKMQFARPNGTRIPVRVNIVAKRY